MKRTVSRAPRMVVGPNRQIVRSQWKLDPRRCRTVWRGMCHARKGNMLCSQHRSDDLDISGPRSAAWSRTVECRGGCAVGGSVATEAQIMNRPKVRARTVPVRQAGRAAARPGQRWGAGDAARHPCHSSDETGELASFLLLRADTFVRLLASILLLIRPLLFSGSTAVWRVTRPIRLPACPPQRAPSLPFLTHQTSPAALAASLTLHSSRARIIISSSLCLPTATLRVDRAQRPLSSSPPSRLDWSRQLSTCDPRETHHPRAPKKGHATGPRSSHG
jgi:hypothetical protein